MNNLSLIWALTLALALCAAHGQVAKPLTEGDLLKSLEDTKGEPVPVRSATPVEKAAPKLEGQTEIDADNGEINNKTHIAIFTGDVIVKNPEFNVTCDKLTAYLKHDDKGAAGATPKAAAPATKRKTGGLEKAIAEMTKGGKVIITQEKKEVDGSTTLSVGKGEKAVYNAGSGEITLSGWPEIRQGINSTVASREDTIIVLTRDGRMRTEGRVKYLVQDSEKLEKPVSKP